MIGNAERHPLQRVPLYFCLNGVGSGVLFGSLGLAGLQLLEQALLPIRTGAMTSYYPTSAVVSDLHKSLDVISRRVAR